jgi:hypothetical protein
MTTKEAKEAQDQAALRADPAADAAAPTQPKGQSEFTKKPMKIQAIRITKKIEIATREGTLYGYPGEWLITGIQGEQYPCGDAIFKQSYEPTGPDKCSYCEYGGKNNRHCDTWEVCIFEWKEAP